jgi:formate-dependent phosphoribosylglycinamide formyltransferase (GAR transformylase)
MRSVDTPASQYFVSSTFDKEHRTQLVNALRSVLDAYGLAAYCAEDERTTKRLQAKIREMIWATRFGIYDLTDPKPNIVMELGMAVALHKPFLLTVQASVQKPVPQFVQNLGLEVIQYEYFSELREPLAARVLGLLDQRKETRPGENGCELEGGGICAAWQAPKLSEELRYLVGIGEGPGEQDFGLLISEPLRQKGLTFSPLLLTDIEHPDHICGYCQMARATAFGVFHLGGDAEAEPDIYLTLGMAVGLKRPLVLLRERILPPLPALATGGRCLLYDKLAKHKVTTAVWREVKGWVLPELRPDTNPFRGLQPFGEQSAAQFAGLGRAGIIERIAGYFGEESGTPGAGSSYSPTVILVGESGVGKSSLIQAGVLPRLKARHDGWISTSLSATEVMDPQVENRLSRKVSELHPGLPARNMDVVELWQCLAGQGRNLLLVLDQFESIFEMDATNRVAPLTFISKVAEQTSIGLLIALRREFYDFIEQEYAGRKLLPDSLARRTYRDKLLRLDKEQAMQAIVRLSMGLFDQSLVQTIVDTLWETDGGEAGPATPYIQLVCQNLWRELVEGQRLKFVTLKECNETRIRATRDRYLQDAVSDIGSELKAIAPKILRCLVDPSDVDRSIAKRKARTEDELAERTATDQVTVGHVVDELVSRRIVDVRIVAGNRTVEVVHDFLAQQILTNYDDKSICLVEAADKLVRDLGMILKLSADGEPPEELALGIVQDFLGQQHKVYEELRPEEKLAVAKRLTPASLDVSGLIRDLDAASRRSRGEARLAKDCLAQVLLLLGAYKEAEDLYDPCENRQLSQDFWLSARQQEVMSGPLDQEYLPTTVADEQLRNLVLRLAQQEQERTLVELRAELLALLKLDPQLPRLDSRLPLWRVLYRLWVGGQILWRNKKTGEYSPARMHQAIWPPADIFSYRWVLAPDRNYLRQHDALQDHRTYQGALVHIPAGEHAMRNQRAARKVMIRTVAIEKGTRSTSPGYHEADDRYLISDYKNDNEFKALLRRIAYDNAVLLNEKDRKLCVVLEAQEYPVERMANMCAGINKDLQALNDGHGDEKDRIQGQVVVDMGVAIANRKDLTRGLAALVGVRQPAFRVLYREEDRRADEQNWPAIWRYCAEHADSEAPLKGWNGAQDAESKTRWLAAVRQAVDELGGQAIVKPVTTEFLKGSTFVTRDRKTLELAWQRAQTIKHAFPRVVVEEHVQVIKKELLVTVVAWPDPNDKEKPIHFVDVPPVWYRCGSPFGWREDATCNSVPTFMDHAWVEQGSAQDAAIFARARTQSEQIAAQYWHQISAQGHIVSNYFLQFEWFVLPDDSLLLNEIKPTQLDKGIISGAAFTHSDSELLVRNLFGLPLPATVRMLRPQETVLVGAVVIKDESDFQPIERQRMLIGYDPAGIKEALAKGVDVFLYSDKMRSVPYIGRRMGILTVTAGNKDEALRIFEEARAVLLPQYDKDQIEPTPRLKDADQVK